MKTDGLKEKKFNNNPHFSRVGGSATPNETNSRVGPASQVTSMTPDYPQVKYQGVPAPPQHVYSSSPSLGKCLQQLYCVPPTRQSAYQFFSFHLVCHPLPGGAGGWRDRREGLAGQREGPGKVGGSIPISRMP
ncbi:unnamed protein product [Pleuronectes platessa]|uniref:Uncharacterized protein n=1 Tax=Pleuronectes platessa TaxID=8262 RepID=A0A9N7YJY4_PLEPL|nr:unnamed protein product [Pleuronectes platessa]